MFGYFHGSTLFLSDEGILGSKGEPQRPWCEKEFNAKKAWTELFLPCTKLAKHSLPWRDGNRNPFPLAKRALTFLQKKKWKKRE